MTSSIVENQDSRLALSNRMALSICTANKTISTLSPTLSPTSTPSSIGSETYSASSESNAISSPLQKHVLSGNLPPDHELLDSCASSQHSDTASSHSDTDDSTSSAHRDCMLFVGDVARNVTEKQLRSFCAIAGEVVSVDIKKDAETGNNRGYGFVQYRTAAEALQARDRLQGKELCGRKIRIGWAQMNTTLFVGDLDDSVTDEELKAVFQSFGLLIDDETYVKGGNNGYGFVRFVNRQDAENAKKTMNKQVLKGRVIRVGWGDNAVYKNCIYVKFNPQQIISSTSTEIRERLQHNAANIIEHNLLQIFAEFGSILNVSLPINSSSVKKIKSFAFIHFHDTPEGRSAAQSALQSMKETVVNGISIKVSLGKRHPSPGQRNASMNGQPRNLTFENQPSGWSPQKGRSTLSSSHPTSGRLQVRTLSSSNNVDSNSFTGPLLAMPTPSSYNVKDKYYSNQSLLYTPWINSFPTMMDPQFSFSYPQLNLNEFYYPAIPSPINNLNVATPRNLYVPPKKESRNSYSDSSASSPSKHSHKRNQKCSNNSSISNTGSMPSMFSPSYSYPAQPMFVNASPFGYANVVFPTDAAGNLSPPALLSPSSGVPMLISPSSAQSMLYTSANASPVASA